MKLERLPENNCNNNKMTGDRPTLMSICAQVLRKYNVKLNKQTNKQTKTNNNRNNKLITHYINRNIQRLSAVTLTVTVSTQLKLTSCSD